MGKPDAQGQVLQDATQDGMFRMIEPAEQRVTEAAGAAGEGGTGTWCLTGGVSFGENERALEGDGGGGCALTNGSCGKFHVMSMLPQ